MPKGFKRYISKELRQQELETYRRKLSELRQRARSERGLRKRRLREQKSACDERVLEADKQAQAEFRRARILALEAQKKATEARHRARDVKRQSARDKCRLERDAVRAEAQAKIDAAKAEAELERAFRRELQSMARGQRQPGPAKAKDRAARRRERQGESDDEVRHNLPPELHHLWQQEKRRIKATPLRTRTEAFLDWVHEHPEAQLEAQQKHLPSDDEMAAAEREYWASRRGMVGGEVPF